MTESCEHMELLLHAELDGELDAAQSARLAAHVAGCADCARKQAELAALQRELRADLPYHRAPAALRRKLTAAPPSLRRWAVPAAFIAGAMAASLAFVTLPRSDGDAAGQMIESHLRALQPGHLVDIASNDQHNVKPWFDGRLDFAPPVKDLAQAGFPLAGGRLDHLAGRPVAALVYRRQQHVIDLFAWPDQGAPDTAPVLTVRDGYNAIRWTHGGFVLWAVSDLSAQDLQAFSRLWHDAP